MDDSCKYMDCTTCKILRPFKYADCSYSQTNPFDTSINAAAILGYSDVSNSRQLRNEVAPHNNVVSSPKNAYEKANLEYGRMLAEQRRRR